MSKYFNGDGSGYNPYEAAATGATLPDDQLPQTTTVFETPQLTADDHVWRQEGYSIMDACQPRTMHCISTGISIGPGRLLHRDGQGKYSIIDETRPELDDKRATPELAKSEADKAEKEWLARQKKKK